MRKAFLLFVFCSFACCVLSQTIAVKSFKKLEGDLSARGNEKKLDQNGEVCAIIKVVTTASGFVFEPDALGIVERVEKTGESWLYVPRGAKRLTVKHGQFGVLRDYLYPLRIDGACVYELVLTTGRVKTVVEEDVGGQYFVLRVKPFDAMVYIDDVYEASTNGAVSKFLAYGKHSWRVESKPYYHTEGGNVDISGEKKIEQSVTLREAFGGLSIASTPESGAEVFVDGVKVGVTPCRVERVLSGEHRVRVVKAQYAPEERNVTVSDGKTAESLFLLAAMFGEIALETDSGSSIWVDDKQVGVGRWEGRLGKGVHVVEVRKPSHRTIRKSLSVEAGEHRTEQLGIPEPIYGKLRVGSTPMDATIRINGRDYGKTPQVIPDLIIGEYELELVKEGYVGIKKKIRIEEGKMFTLEEVLADSYKVHLQTNSGTVVHVDGEWVGMGPQTLSLKYGHHTIKGVLGGYVESREIDVRTDGQRVEMTLPDYGKEVYVSILTKGMEGFVSVDQKYIGYTPLTVKLLPREYLVSIRVEGRTVKKNIVVQPNLSQTFEIRTPSGAWKERFQLGMGMEMDYNDMFSVGGRLRFKFGDYDDFFNLSLGLQYSYYVWLGDEMSLEAHQISLPAVMKFNVCKLGYAGKCRYYLAGGTGYNFNVSASYSDYLNGNVKEKKMLRPYSWSLIGETGFAWRRWELGFYYRHDMQPLFNQRYIYEHEDYYSVEKGINNRYRFGFSLMFYFIL